MHFSEDIILNGLADIEDYYLATRVLARVREAGSPQPRDEVAYSREIKHAQLNSDHFLLNKSLLIRRSGPIAKR